MTTGSMAVARSAPLPDVDALALELEAIKVGYELVLKKPGVANIDPIVAAA